MTDDPLARARREAAELLGLNPDKLSAGERLKCELIAALRSVVDDELGKVDRANAADLGRLIIAIETLTKFLAEAKPKDGEQHSVFRKNPYEVLDNLAQRWRAADEADRAERGLPPRVHGEAETQKRIEELEAENLRLRGQGGQDPKALPAPEAKAERVIDPPTSAITPPGEQSDRAANGAYAPDLKGPRPGMTIDGKVIPPQAKSGAETRAQADRVNSDRSIVHKIMTEPSRVAHEPQPSSPMTTFGDSGFYFGGNKGRSW